METLRPPYRILVLVCTNFRDDGRASCGARDSAEILSALKQGEQSRNLPVPIRISRAGCLDLCGMGPVVLVYPEGRLYAAVRLQDVDRILDETLGSAGSPTDSFA